MRKENIVLRQSRGAVQMFTSMQLRFSGEAASRYRIGSRSVNTRVVLADDHPKVRAGIRGLLNRAPDIDVVGEASDGVEALQLVEELSPDVLVLDVEMPQLTGVEVAKRLRAKGSPVRIIAISAYHDRQYITGMLSSGASGYLTKEEVPEKVVKAVRGVANGEEGWVSRRVARQIGAGNKGH